MRDVEPQIGAGSDVARVAAVNGGRLAALVVSGLLLVVLAGCSKDSPTAPKTPANVVFERWYQDVGGLSSGYVKNVGGTTASNVRIFSHFLVLDCPQPYPYPCGYKSYADTVPTTPGSIPPGELGGFRVGSGVNGPTVDKITWQ